LTEAEAADTIVAGFQGYRARQQYKSKKQEVNYHLFSSFISERPFLLE